MTREFGAHLALFCVAVIYGANFVIAKSVMPDPIAPNAFIAMRVCGAVLLFWLVSYRYFQLPRREDLWRFALCGLTGVATNQLLFFNGLALTSPINGAIIMTSNPILVMLISAYAARQHLSLRRTSGVIAGAVGAIALIVLSGLDASRSSNLVGDLFVLINSASYACYLVLVKPLMRKYHPLQVVTWTFTFGMVFVLPFGGLGLATLPWGDFTAWQWFAVLFVIICVTFLTYLLNTLALSVVSPTTTSSYIYLQPLLAGLSGWIYHISTGREIGQQFGAGKWVCTALILAGVYLVSTSDRLKPEG